MAGKERPGVSRREGKQKPCGRNKAGDGNAREMWTGVSASAEGYGTSWELLVAKGRGPVKVGDVEGRSNRTEVRWSVEFALQPGRVKHRKSVETLQRVA